LYFWAKKEIQVEVTNQMEEIAMLLAKVNGEHLVPIGSDDSMG
jgi:hypothetical protein